MGAVGNDDAPDEGAAEADVPDARDGLTRKERVVLRALARAQAERGGRDVPLPLLHARVLQQIDLPMPELVAIVARLAGRRG